MELTLSTAQSLPLPLHPVHQCVTAQIITTLSISRFKMSNGSVSKEPRASRMLGRHPFQKTQMDLRGYVSED